MKKFLLKIILFFFTFSFPLYFSSKEIYGQQEFKTISQITYKFYENGNCAVTHEISLINLKPEVYVTEYLLKITGENVINPQAWDLFGPLKLTSTKEGNTTSIFLKFNESVVGKNQALSFIVKYEIINLAKKEGNVWKIILPKINESVEESVYSLFVKVPLSYGDVAFSSPSFESFEKEGSYAIYSFPKNKILQRPLMMEFGYFQVFDFTLLYQLKNQSSSKSIATIAIPPDTAYQKVGYTSIDPSPEEVNTDEDGNWLAKFILQPNSEIEIKVKGKVQVFPKPQNNEYVKSLSPERYLEEKLYWEVNNPEIKNIAQNLKNPKDIYNFLINKLSYDYERIKIDKKRLGAVETLKNPTNSLCLEFTDVFVTLSRAAGIPAREIEGFAITDNPKLRPLSLVHDVLHAWPEYYDFEKRYWKMIDPTWGKTTGGFDYFDNFDMSHITFVIHGVDSQYPLPPGSYKLNNEVKNIFVEYGDSFFSNLPKPEIKIVLNNLPPLSVKGFGFLEIFNPGPTAIYNLPLEITSNINMIFEPSEKIVSHLLPFSKKIIPFEIKLPSFFLTTLNTLITIKLGNIIKEEPVIFIGYQKIINMCLFAILICFLLFLIVKFKREKFK